MRRIFLLLAVAVLGVASASADTLCTDLLGTNVLTPGFSCELGGLVFSNFSANLTGAINLTGAVASGSAVYLTFNPNMAPATGDLDRYFYLTVTGGVIGVDLINAGSDNTSIYERVCSTPIGVGNTCTGGTANQLASMAAFGGESSEVWFQQTYSPIYIFKDIYVPEREHLSSFTQSFHTPEPLTFGLIGSGLLLLGLLRRKAR